MEYVEIKKDDEYNFSMSPVIRGFDLKYEVWNNRLNEDKTSVYIQFKNYNGSIRETLTKKQLKLMIKTLNKISKEMEV